MPTSSGRSNGFTWGLIRVVSPGLAIWHFPSPQPLCLQPSCTRQMGQLVAVCHTMPSVSSLPLQFWVSWTLVFLCLLPVLAPQIPLRPVFFKLSTSSLTLFFSFSPIYFASTPQEIPSLSLSLLDCGVKASPKPSWSAWHKNPSEQ